MTKNFIITEIRKNREGHEYPVDTFMQAASLDDILDRLREKFPKTIQENRFRVREIQRQDIR